MESLLISPPAINTFPPVILHGLIVGYLLGRQKSGETWFLIAWQTCLFLLMASQFAARVIYTPFSAYLDWSGILWAGLAVVFMLQFVYRCPRSLYPREARIVWGLSALLWGGLAALIIFEATSRPAIINYSFEEFRFGFLGPTAAPGLFTSANAFDILQPLTFLWAIGVWLRQAVFLSRLTAGQPALSWGWRQTVQALWSPRGQEARTARAFALTLTGGALATIVSALEARNMLPAGSFGTAYLLIFFIFIVLYLNNAPEPSTFKLKLVGISLFTLLALVGLGLPVFLNLYRADAEQTRQAQLDDVKHFLERGDLATIPAQVLYVAARPLQDGLFSSHYRLLFSRVEDLNAQTFIEQDARLKGLLALGNRVSVLLENPWLGVDLPDSNRPLEQIPPPERVVSYRGIFDPAGRHFIRYSLARGDTLYEVGYSYLAYRRALHRYALSIVTLTLLSIGLILIIFPRFFQATLVQPLQDLLAGVKRVEEGDLSTRVPVTARDELGLLTRSFNGMVQSLSESEAELRRHRDHLEELVQQRTRHLTALYELSATTNEYLDVPSVLNRVLEKTLAAVGNEIGLIHLLDEDKSDTLSLVAQQGLGAEAIPLIVAPSGRPAWWEQVRRENRPIVVADIFAGRPDLDLRGLARTPAYVGVPIRLEGNVLGVLSLLAQTVDHFSADDIVLLAAIADNAGRAVERVRLGRRAEEAAVVEERQRLARDLHDSVTQSLYSLVLFATAGHDSLQAGRLTQLDGYLGQLDETARQALREMRLLIYELRPLALAQAGLVGALRQRLEAVEGRAGLETHLQVDLPGELPAPVELGLYQITQEALNNVLKHSCATRVTVCLTANDSWLQLEVTDNGRGLAGETGNAGGGFGLTSMRERAEKLGGLLQMVSQPGQGTRIIVTLPFVAL